MRAEVTAQLLEHPAFPYPLLGQWELTGEAFHTTAPFLYDDKEKGIRVLVRPRRTDFHSIPRAAQVWFPATQYPAAGLVHDELYDEPYAYVNDVYRELTRGECDDIWRRILHLTGCRKSKRVTAWLGLRAGGWAAWNRHRRADETKRGLGGFL